MRKLLKLVIAIMLIVIALAGVFAFLLLENRKQYTLENRHLGSFVSRIDQDLKIGIVGDSWAAGKKLDESLGDELLDLGFSPEIISYGHPGGKSRDILRDLCENKQARSLIDDEDIDIIILMVGVNDSKGHDGPDFYNYHVNQLLSLVASRGALAVVLDVPNYGIEFVEAPSFSFWAKRQASRFLFDSGKRDNRDAYRIRLTELAEINPHVAVVRSHSLPSFYDNPELWRDSVHLNTAGYSQAAKPIAAIVAKIYETALTTTPTDSKR